MTVGAERDPHYVQSNQPRSHFFCRSVTLRDSLKKAVGIGWVEEQNTRITTDFTTEILKQIRDGIIEIGRGLQSPVSTRPIRDWIRLTRVLDGWDRS